MHKKVGALIVGSVLLVPIMSSALSAPIDTQSILAQLMKQIAQLQEQIRQLQNNTTPTTPVVPTTTTVAPGCVTIGRNLAPGDSDATAGGEVSKLQRFLAQDSSIYPEGSVTGYFGDATARAVKKWQASVRIYSSGGASVGPLTRAAMLKCVPISPKPASGLFSATPTTGGAPLAVRFSVRSAANAATIDYGDGTSETLPPPWAGCSIEMANANQCGLIDISHTYTANGTYKAVLYKQSAGYEPALDSSCTGNCAVITGIAAASIREVVGTITITVGGTSGSISISGLDAPNSLTVGQAGTWRVRASAPAGTQLSYSVVWGDESNSVPWSDSSAAASINTSSSFTHTYSSAGTYTPIFTVSSGAASAKTSASVTVTGGTTGASLSATPTSGSAPLSVTFTSLRGTPSNLMDFGYTLYFGDGTSQAVHCDSNTANWTCTAPIKIQHTYAQSGTYTATLKSGGYCFEDCTQTHGSVTITVTGGTTCLADVQAAQAYAADKICGQGGSRMMCPHDSSYTTQTLTTCEEGYLRERGWTSATAVSACTRYTPVYTIAELSAPCTYYGYSSSIIN